MTFEGVVSLGTTLAIVSLISHMAEEYADDQDMDSYWTCISVLTRVAQVTGHDAFHTLPASTQGKASALALLMLAMAKSSTSSAEAHMIGANDP